MVIQLNTNLTRESLKPGIKSKTIYTFKVLEFDDYRFISKKRIDGTIHDEMDKD